MGYTIWLGLHHKLKMVITSAGVGYAESTLSIAVTKYHLLLSSIALPVTYTSHGRAEFNN